MISCLNFSTLLSQRNVETIFRTTFQTLHEVYKVYTNFWQEQNSSFSSQNVFNKVFNDKNLSLFCQKKDQCNKYFTYKYNNITRQEWKEYIKKKDKGRRHKADTKILSKRRSNSFNNGFGGCQVFTLFTSWKTIF